MNAKAELRKARTIAEIAKDLGYATPTGFSQAFKKKFGLTPKQWRVQEGLAGKAGHNLQKAKDLLLSTDLKVGEISIASGFVSRMAMKSAFLRHTGLPPSKWRAAMREGRA
ncbi:helix-turn-helix domain-containing protein [Qipengyuania sp. ASV99]|uniref:helix-turn-helix domain-containing protein n=1 Tax=Qipengyuania sp. ASV99 TaxID=3399681 RepID=UPI003A4C6565